MKATTANDNRGRESVRGCPVCARRSDERQRPFCSRRCAEVDLYRWLSEAYVINGRDDDKDRAMGDRAWMDE
jgi:uncharacterized protein